MSTENAENMYQTPEADMDEVVEGSKELFVVSVKKLAIMNMLSYNLYSLYYFYKHWDVIRNHNHLKLWPIPRAIFAVFFVFPLFSRFEKARSAAGVGEAWNYTSPAVALIVIMLISIFSSWGDGLFYELPLGLTLLVSLVVMVLITVILCSAQRVANLAMGDPDGEENSKLTPPNYVWIFIGLAFWLFGIFALFTAA